MALEKEEEEERNKTIESLKTALRTQPMRYILNLNRHYTVYCILLCHIVVKTIHKNTISKTFHIVGFS